MTAPDTEPVAARTFHTRSGLLIAADHWPAAPGAPGTDDRPPVVLVHGGGQTRHSWGGTAAVLAASGWEVVAYDQRGHGDSGRPVDRDYRAQRFAEDLVDVCVALRDGTGAAPVVVGASLGGLAGLLAEGDLAPGTVSALVLVDVTPRLEPSGVDRILGFMLERMDEGYASLEEAADAVAAYQPHRPRRSDTTGLAKNLRQGADGRWRWHWDPDLFRGPWPVGRGGSQGGYDMAAAALDVPVMLVRGRLSDLVSPETARHFLEVQPNAEFVDVSDAGHMVAGDRNDAFTDAVAGFLGRLADRVDGGTA